MDDEDDFDLEAEIAKELASVEPSAVEKEEGDSEDENILELDLDEIIAEQQKKIIVQDVPEFKRTAVSLKTLLERLEEKEKKIDAFESEVQQIAIATGCTSIFTPTDDVAETPTVPSPLPKEDGVPMNTSASASMSGSKGDSLKKKRRKTHDRWTEQENARLVEAVEIYEQKSWNEIAKHVGTKKSDQCNQHWHRVLNPRISKAPWAAEEDTLLTERVAEFGKSAWKKVSEGFKGRTDVQCRHRWIRLGKATELKAVASSSDSESRTEDEGAAPLVHAETSVQSILEELSAEQEESSKKWAHAMELENLRKRQRQGESEREHEREEEARRDHERRERAERERREAEKREEERIAAQRAMLEKKAAEEQRERERARELRLKKEEERRAREAAERAAALRRRREIAALLRQERESEERTRRAALDFDADPPPPPPPPPPPEPEVPRPSSSERPPSHTGGGGSSSASPRLSSSNEPLKRNTPRDSSSSPLTLKMEGAQSHQSPRDGRSSLPPISSGKQPAIVTAETGRREGGSSPEPSSSSKANRETSVEKIKGTTKRTGGTYTGNQGSKTSESGRPRSASKSGGDSDRPLTPSPPSTAVGDKRPSTPSRLASTTSVGDRARTPSSTGRGVSPLPHQRQQTPPTPPSGDERKAHLVLSESSATSGSHIRSPSPRLPALPKIGALSKPTDSEKLPSARPPSSRSSDHSLSKTTPRGAASTESGSSSSRPPTPQLKLDLTSVRSSTSDHMLIGSGKQPIPSKFDQEERRPDSATRPMSARVGTPRIRTPRAATTTATSLSALNNAATSSSIDGSSLRRSTTTTTTDSALFPRPSSATTKSTASTTSPTPFSTAGGGGGGSGGVFPGGYVKIADWNVDPDIPDTVVRLTLSLPTEKELAAEKPSEEAKPKDPNSSLSRAITNISSCAARSLQIPPPSKLAMAAAAPPSSTSCQTCRTPVRGGSSPLDESTIMSHVPDYLVGSPHITCLRALDLTVEGLTHASRHLPSHLTSLRALNLGVNALTALPPGGLFSAPPELRSFTISDNSLICLHGADQLHKLQTLNASTNRLADIPLLPSALVELNLGNNVIKNLNGVVRPLTSLQKLDLYRNELSSLTPLKSKCPALLSLDCGRNSITSLQRDVLSTMPFLQTLILYNNSISFSPDDPPLPLPMLRQLWLGSNRISALPKVLALSPHLQQVHFNDNQIESVPKTLFIGCRALTTVSFAFNQIRNLGDVIPALMRCPRLTTLSLNDNPFSQGNPRGYRSSVLRALPTLVELDTTPVDDQQRKLYQTNVKVPVPPIPGHPDPSRAWFLRKFDHLVAVHLSEWTKLESGIKTEMAKLNKQASSGEANKKAAAKSDDLQRGTLGSFLRAERKRQATHETIHDEAIPRHAKSRADLVRKQMERLSKFLECWQDPLFVVHESWLDAQRLATVTIIQKWWRSVARVRIRAARKLQAWYRHCRHHKRWLCAVKIQAIWRGHRVRRVLKSVKMRDTEFDDLDFELEDPDLDWLNKRPKYLDESDPLADLGFDPEAMLNAFMATMPQPALPPPPPPQPSTFILTADGFVRNQAAPPQPQPPQAQHHHQAFPKFHQDSFYGGSSGGGSSSGANDQPPPSHGAGGSGGKSHKPPQQQAQRQARPEQPSLLDSEGEEASGNEGLTSPSGASSVLSPSGGGKKDKKAAMTDLANEWGFKDPRTVAAMMKKRQKFEKMQKKKELAKEMQDPRRRLEAFKKHATAQPSLHAYHSNFSSPASSMDHPPTLPQKSDPPIHHAGMGAVSMPPARLSPPGGSGAGVPVRSSYASVDPPSSAISTIDLEQAERGSRPAARDENVRTFKSGAPNLRLMRNEKLGTQQQVKINNFMSPDMSLGSQQSGPSGVVPKPGGPAALRKHGVVK